MVAGIEGPPSPVRGPEVVYRANAMSDEQPAVPPDEVPPEQGAAGDAAPAPEEPSNKKWYVVKVQSGREESIKDAIVRRVKIEGLEEFFGQIFIPVERVTEMVKNKRVTKEKKLYPGYLMVEVEYNDDFVSFPETSGVGTSWAAIASRPAHRPRSGQDESAEKPRRSRPGKAPFEIGDRVRVRDGAFAGMEGEVKDLMEAKGQVRIELTLCGRPVTHELEYWQVETV